MTKHIPEPAWASELHRFTTRNAGRSTKLEIDDVDFGAQEQQSGWPFRGIAYDARDGRVFITFGEQSSVEHLTHTVTGADDIYVLVDVRGRDEALAIRQHSSSTLLRFMDL